MNAKGEVTGVARSASAVINGVRISYASTAGPGEPLVLVHGSWGSRHHWDPVIPGLAGHFQVVAYDRRGHSESERPPGQGSFAQDVDDLAELIEHLRLAPAWVVGNSAGAVITLKLAAARPELLRGIVVHEPPMWSLVHEGTAGRAAFAEAANGPLAEVLRRIELGDNAGAAELFVEEVALGAGCWPELPVSMRETMVHNAPTFLDEGRDPEAATIDEAALARFAGPVLLTSGDQSPPLFGPVLDRLEQVLPHPLRRTYVGAGHVPYVTHPEQYIASLIDFARARTRARS
ncbi:MAG TPA: alpha/beta hydrolase [Nocardioidaceae bacterium]|nr:alpha/beta hydrolase [Nocardioidaceae bacterium]